MFKKVSEHTVKIIIEAPLPGPHCTHGPKAFLCYCLLRGVVNPTAPETFHLGQLEALLATPASDPSPIPSKIPKKKSELRASAEPCTSTFWRMKHGRRNQGPGV